MNNASELGTLLRFVAAVAHAIDALCCRAETAVRDRTDGAELARDVAALAGLLSDFDRLGQATLEDDPEACICACDVVLAALRGTRVGAMADGLATPANPATPSIHAWTAVLDRTMDALNSMRASASVSTERANGGRSLKAAHRTGSGDSP